MADIPSTTLDEVEVTAPATVTNPTASTAYKPEPPAGGDDLTLTIGSVNWIGWQRVQLTRSIDRVPASFDILVTERYPNGADIDIKPGAPCSVKLGGDLVLTGFVDRYECVVNAKEHSVHISGRSKSQDLVDCAAFVGGKEPDAEQYQIPGGTAVSIIKKLAAGYDITVTNQGPEGPTLPAFPINLGETAWEIIDRMTKYAQLLAYDMPDGSIMLAQAGNEKMSSGFEQGVNVEEAQVQFTMDQRFSVYEGFAVATPVLSMGGGGHMPPQAIEHDETARAFRKRIIVSEQPIPGGLLVTQRVTWEKNRRLGRSQAITITADSWRDNAGNLWAPNHTASVNVPAVKVKGESWVIGQVTYVKDERGRHAAVMLMPKGAFLPEPMALPGAFPTAGALGIGTSNPTSANPVDAPAPPADTRGDTAYQTGNLSAGGGANLNR